MKAMLIEVSFTTRVVVEDNATEWEMLVKAHHQLQRNLMDEGAGYVADNLMVLEEDEEVPYDEKYDRDETN